MIAMCTISQGARGMMVVSAAAYIVVEIQCTIFRHRQLALQLCAGTKHGQAGHVNLGREMKQAHEICVTKTISAYGKSAEWQHALSLVEGIGRTGVTPSVISFNAAICRSCCCCCRSCCCRCCCCCCCSCCCCCYLCCCSCCCCCCCRCCCCSCCNINTITSTSVHQKSIKNLPSWDKKS